MNVVFSTEPFIKKIHVQPTNHGILDHLTFAVKDVIGIKDQITGCGNPTWFSHQSPCKVHATVVEQLLASGATCTGKTILGEFCSGSLGVNHFYGMPKNYNAPKHVPGGSSSGSASAVSEGIIDFSLGTDAAGSIRIPASFCGVFGMRPSHGLISMNGIESFSSSFDTVGIFSQTIEILERVFEVFVNKNHNELHQVNNLYVLQEYLHCVKPEERNILNKFIEGLAEILQLNPIFINLQDIHIDAYDEQMGFSACFKKILCAEIWTEMEPMIKKYKLEFSKNTYVDFNPIASIAKTILPEVIERKELYCLVLNQLLKRSDLLCIPTTPDLPPLRKNTYERVNEFDYNKLRPFVALSSLGKLPQISIPIKNNISPPLGISLLSGHNQDQFLISMVKRIINKK